MAKLRKTAKQAQAAEDQAASAAHSPTAASKTHSFSRTIAQQHGEKAAVLLQYLAHHVAKSKHVHGGRKWFYKTLDDLAAVFPYIKRSTIHDTLKSLKDKGVLRIGDFNKKGYDRTCWYAFEDDNVRKQAQSSEPAYFKVEDAVKYGIVAAVLLGNLEHWIRENRKEDPGYTWHQILPGELTKHLPFSKSTIQRALRMLVDKKVLRCKTKPGKGQTAKYALVDEKRLTEQGQGGSKSDMLLDEGGSNPDRVSSENEEEGGSKPDMGGGSNPDRGRSKSDMPGSKPDMGGSFSDMGGSNPDNNTILIENLLEEPRLKEPGYVEPGLPNTVSTSSKTEKLKQVRDVHPFAQPIFKTGKGTGSAKSQQSKLSGTGSGPPQLLTVSGTGQLQDSGKDLLSYLQFQELANYKIQASQLIYRSHLRQKSQVNSWPFRRHRHPFPRPNPMPTITPMVQRAKPG